MKLIKSLYVFLTLKLNLQKESGNLIESTILILSVGHEHASKNPPSITIQLLEVLNLKSAIQENVYNMVNFS